MKKLESFKTWIGIGATIIGITGLAQFITPENFEKLVNAIFTIAGILVTVYGNYKSHQKIEELGGYKRTS